MPLASAGVAAGTADAATTAPVEAPVEAPLDEPLELPIGEGDPELRDATITDRPWIVIVWNDPVNLMSYVVLVLQQLFGYSREKATRLMLQVHHEGKAAVSEGSREKCEADVARLHGRGLWATMEHPA
jgi:ATP-dependent Clp protease adaptor protein ClpS